MLKVLLCIPPDYGHNFPPLGTAALSAFLRQNGVQTQQKDLNFTYRDFLAGHIKARDMLPEVKLKLLEIVRKEFFRSKLTGRYYSDFLPRDKDTALAFIPYNNNSNSSFYFTERILSSPLLWRYLGDESENTFLQFFRNIKMIDSLDKERIGLLGISIISPSQVIPAFTLGLLVKKHLAHIHVSIGGQWPTLFRAQLAARRDFFRCFDSVVVFEGETPLLRLVENLTKGKDSPVKNILFKETPLDFLDHYTEENMDSLPCPDFDGLPVDSYDAIAENQGRVGLTYETSRGCYWSKCAYCVDLPLPKQSYRAKSPELVGRDIRELKRKYNMGHFMASDPGISPRQMRGVARCLEGTGVNWWSMARLDPGFSLDVFTAAAKSGLTQLNFGFESANDSVCQTMHKGNMQQRSERVIRDCFVAGVRVDLQTMLGLPGEKFQYGLDTVNFLIKNEQFIYDVTFNIYYLTPGNHVYLDPGKYGIVVQQDEVRPFSFFIPFKNLNGMSKNEAMLLERLYYNLAGKIKPENFDRIGIYSGEARQEELEFTLNSETVKMAYSRRGAGDEVQFVLDEAGVIK